MRKIVLAVRYCDAGMSRLVEELGAYEPDGKVAPRIVDYYLTNALLLGMIDRDNLRTPQGRALIALSAEHQIRRLAYAFEVSDIGRRWLRFAGAKDLQHLNPASADRFVTDLDNGRVSNETLNRRAGTLRRWCEQFREALRQLVLKAGESREFFAESDVPVVFDRGGSAPLLRRLSAAARRIDVATAFFTLEGFRELAVELEHVDLRLMVGGDERSQHDAEMLMRIFEASLRPSLQLELWDRRAVINRLHELLVSGRCRVDSYEARARSYLHAKVYLFSSDGPQAAYVTSANLTLGGLCNNIEDGKVTRNADELTYIRQRFEHYWQQATPLTGRFLDAIEECWVMNPDPDPRLVLLRMLHELYGKWPRLPFVPYPLPELQKAIIGGILAKFEQVRGLLLVAPTGIGKTVMSAYVGKYLQTAQKIERVIVVCKNKTLQGIWSEKLAAFRLGSAWVRVYDLERADPEIGLKGALKEIFDSLSARDLVIVDESHHFRRHESQRHESLAEFLRGPSPDRRPYALLLTATPMSIDIDHLNHQLAAIQAPPLDDFADAQDCPALLNVAIGPLMRDFPGGRATRDGYVPIDFGGVVKYLAKIKFETISYRSLVDGLLERIEKISILFDKIDPNVTQAIFADEDDGDSDVRREFNYIFLPKLLARRAESSIEALETTLTNLRNALDSGLLVPAAGSTFPQELAELTTAARRIPREPGRVPKLDRLVRLVKKLGEGTKILIFSEYRPTVARLREVLEVQFPRRRIALVHGGVDARVRRSIFRRFAPLAQGVETASGPDLDTLVATDAISEGESLQDAHFLVSYDLPWTPLTLIQRVGRVDRFSRDKRKVKVFNFFPATAVYERIVNLRSRLVVRGLRHKKFSGTEFVEPHERVPATLATETIEILHKLEAGTIDYATLVKDVVEKPLPPTAVFNALWGAPPDELRRARALPEGCVATYVGSPAGHLALIRSGSKLSLLWRAMGESAIRSAPTSDSYDALLRIVGTMGKAVEMRHELLQSREASLMGLIRDWCAHEGGVADEAVELVAAIECLEQEPTPSPAPTIPAPTQRSTPTSCRTRAKPRRPPKSADGPVQINLFSPPDPTNGSS
ncbi:MAG: DEAD/DEAH box helicase family protein [Myxococcales bacterium]|nr:DEAD/DEAH box helicase family protein [Myxococcales bacterium]